MLGILYAEDFDDPPAPASAPEPEPEPAPGPAGLTQEDLDRACAEAVAQARAGWEAERRQQSANALATISAALGAAREQAEREAALLAEGTVTTMLAMLSGALPRLCREHGPAEVRALVRHLVPVLHAENRITIRAHADLVTTLQDDLAELETELAGTVAITPAPCEPGDLRVTWECGSFQRDTKRILQAMQDALAQLGLLQPLDFTPDRRMAHAE